MLFVIWITSIKLSMDKTPFWFCSIHLVLQDSRMYNLDKKSFWFCSFQKILQDNRMHNPRWGLQLSITR